MINLQDVIRQLTDSGRAIQALVENLSDEQAEWKPDPHSWSVRQVMEHMYTEELNDFRCHLQEMLGSPPQVWGALKKQPAAVENWRQAVAHFVREREQSLAWLPALDAPNWQVTIQSPFKHQGEAVILSAGDVLLSWVAHDFLHLRQLIELHYAWRENQSPQGALRYAGDW